MKLYTAWWPERFKRVIGKLSKNGKVLEDIFACVPFPMEEQMIVVLSHIDNVAFSIDKYNQRITYDVKVKKLDQLRPLDDFHPSNIKHLEKQYIEATTSLFIPDEVFEDNKIIV